TAGSRMASFQSKLARLPAMPGAVPAAPAVAPGPSAPARPAPGPGPVAGRPSLDDLRDRIARILARAPAPAPRPDPTRGELPFMVEHTDRGPLYVRRERSV